ncbi:protein MMS22-like isoform X2 [Cyclopterus lumpus]|uniref:protein MMS22-like isoform X2 n=1 Tax=Cyclopterus lumpus TaxID=8103 RepID=UPI0014865B14|nr:protein MMS22-like isoform X2 [Cyclopterus lumpus]
MEDDFSQSLTPPVSPFAADSLCEMTPARPACFCCSVTKEEPTGALSTEGYAARGSLKRLLLHLDPAPAEYETDTVEVFGFPWVTETALVESTKPLFGLFRQKLYRLESLVQSSSHDFGQAGNLHYEAEDLRQQCVSFLQYVKVFLHRYLEPSSSLEAGPSHPYEELEAQFPSALLEELFGITLLIGRLKDLPANVQSAFTIPNPGKIFPPSWHLLHLHLDIHWSVLEILHLLGHKMHGQVVYAHQFVNLTGENLTDTSLFEEHLCSLLCDLTGLAMGKYSKVRPTEALSTHHHLCSCTKELWVLLMHLLEYRNKVLHTQSFWSYMNSLLRPLVSGKPAAEQFSGLPTHCKDPLSFTWWLVTHVSMLGQYSRNGTLRYEKHLGDNWTLVEELLKFTCNPKGGLAEEQVRMHVHCCLSLCLLWEPSTSAVSTLWDYYCKNLSASFSVPWLGMSGMGTLCKTPLALLDQARSCCSPSPLHSSGHTQLYRSANSFHIFLRVLALCLAQDRAGGVPQRQIKGRRVHQRSVQSAPPLAWAPGNGSVVKERHLAVAAALWAHFFPFLRSLRLSQTPPAQLADAAAGFTLLALDLPSSAPQDLQPHPVQSIMQCFGWDDMVQPVLITRYLPHLLQNSELLSSLSGDSAQRLSVRAWFRCVLQQHLQKNPDGSDSRTGRDVEGQLCELTRLVLRLPEVDSLLQRAGLQPTASGLQPTAALEVFVKAVGGVYSGLQVLSERSSMVTRALDYIGDILKHIKPSLVSKNQEGLQLVYWAVGCIVKHWSPLLATAKAQQLLFRIVDGLLLPLNLTQQDKALRDSLPLYLQGLSVASSVSQSQGAHLKQQLRSVTRRYLDHFLPVSPSMGVITNHPVLLSACEAAPTTRGAALRRTILEVLCESFLQFKGHAPPPRLAAVLMFLLELLRRNSDSDPALLTLPLPPLLRCVMLVNEPQVRKTSTDALQLVVERCAAASTAAPCNQMIAVLRSFVEENEGVYDRQVYSVLETVSVLDPAVVQALLPHLSLSLRNTERKRGLGRNVALRSAYRKLLCLLGESGQAEITSLETD